MSKRLLWGLLLIALSILVLLLNTRGHLSICIFPAVTLTVMKSMAFLIFLALGVTIGILLK